MPPLRGNGDHLKQCLRAALDAVTDAEIPDRDMYTLFDGSRPGLKPQLLAGFTASAGTLLRKSVRQLRLIKNEETYLSRFKKVRGFAYDLMETIYCVTSGPLDMPYTKRRVHPRTNRSNSMGQIMCPSFTSEEAHNVIP